jgi:hypothetical protein
MIMKKKILDIDIDFIGGQGPLTVEEEKALSDFFRKRKNTLKNPVSDRKRSALKKIKISI